MKVEVTIDRTKKLPDGAVPALELELKKRIDKSYADCKLTVRRAGSDGLNIVGGEKADKKRIEEILQETWESADEWFY
ncbi:DinI-like family protein [Pluralibacter gergoviae]|uniref:DinI-like family protein n=1 Tax=Pluralibacter gergoviae TaxID=61647 RepID=UPI000A3610DC|nr:DinI-like family protein [Pluralibacter gergoviae]EKT9641777.1 DinI-like family protein [Pluralibacter gergoviae]EKV3545292.1 DinI-like family protein [Pluralibacter gergoviae]EKV9898218.1 DinI-like family protein [Pluralibacter gergoviae]EKV9933495.1 DinI-like family protein [Pluralibacter gergoviae]ELO7480475.1 DinI-like family protein [Pluralibacter gergoviae]